MNTNSKYIYEKHFGITSHQGNAKLNYIGISSCYRPNDCHTNEKCYWECGGTEPLYTANGNTNEGGTSMAVPHKMKAQLSYDPSILFQGIYPRESTYHRDTCMSLCTVALATKAKGWKRPRCSSTGTDWSKCNVWHWNFIQL